MIEGTWFREGSGAYLLVGGTIGGRWAESMEWQTTRGPVEGRGHCQAGRTKVVEGSPIVVNGHFDLLRQVWSSAKSQVTLGS